jgi:serine/threonine-protein kinase
MIGTTIGQYRVVDKLGEGGMGEVYRAVDTMLEREVALKVLHRFGAQDASRLERFRSEAVTLARLNHPNIAILHNFFEVGQDYYMVMEYVEGENFDSLMRRSGKLPLRTVLEWFCQALKGFEHAHARGVIHRDIKPANLMLNGEGLVKITDFGIARVMGGQRLTQTGKLIGTLEYMSPEQVRGEEQDARSDIYSLGILLHELSTGQVPFSGASDYEIMHAHLENVPQPPRELDGSLPPEIESAILKALSKNPGERFQTAGEFRAAIEPALANLPATGEKVVLPIKGTREAAALVAESLVPGETALGPEYSGPPATKAADSPKADATDKPAALPIAWLTPKLALGVGLAFLAVMIIAALAMRRAPDAGSTPQPVVKAVVPPTPQPAPKVEDDKKDESDVPAIVAPKRPQPVITPIPTPEPKPKPAPKPTPKPKPKPAPKPTPKPRTTVKRRSSSGSSSSKSSPRRSTKRRSTPKRSAPRRSAPKKRSGGDGVIGIIKNS